MPELAGAADAPPRIVIAFDFGRRRIGVASGNTVSRTATPIGVIAADGGEPRWADIAALWQQLEPRIAVVGLPYNVDGSDSAMTSAAKQFADELARRYPVRVARVDERYSSREAGERLKAARSSGTRRRRVAKSDVDAEAACVILDRWFDEEGMKRDALPTG
jgi:putative holliday junction resolvase